MTVLEYLYWTLNPKYGDISDQTWADFVFKIKSFDWTCPNTRVNLKKKMQWRVGEDVCGALIGRENITVRAN